MWDRQLVDLRACCGHLVRLTRLDARGGRLLHEEADYYIRRENCSRRRGEKVPSPAWRGTADVPSGLSGAPPVRREPFEEPSRELGIVRIRRRARRLGK